MEEAHAVYKGSMILDIVVAIKTVMIEQLLTGFRCEWATLITCFSLRIVYLQV